MTPRQGDERGATRNAIGKLRESSLHGALKRWYAQPGDEFEAEVDGYIVDLRRGDLVIEIQTSSFSSIREKLGVLVKNHRVLLSYPIARERWIVKIDPESGERIGRRKSPKRGRCIDLFDELVRIPALINHPNLSLEAVLILEEQIRCADGRGSWRRRGVSIRDRELVEVLETRRFDERGDLLALLPVDLPELFTNKLLAQHLTTTVRRAQRATYALKKMGAIRAAGKTGRELFYEIAR